MDIEGNPDDESFPSVSYSSSDEEDQFGGGGDHFSIQKINERHIAKFNVHGFDYKVKVEPLRQNASYEQVLQNLHNILSGM